MQMDPISTGTTIISFKYRDGIILAADSRTSSGVYIPSRITDKINKLTANIYICRSGSAADTQIIQRIVASEVKKLGLIENTKPSVEKAARLISKIIRENREYLKAAIIVAGIDDKPRIFKINICGTVEEDNNILIGGSGSGFIYGFCDYKYSPEMELEEALEFAKTAVKLATHRDISSGGVTRIAAITKNGVQRYFVSGENNLEI